MRNLCPEGFHQAFDDQVCEGTPPETLKSMIIEWMTAGLAEATQRNTS